MKEQSHKDEMSAALRGDFQRLRDRGVAASLVPHETAEPSPAHEPPAPSEQAAQAAHGPDTPGTDEQREDRGWLSRLVGRERDRD